MGPHPTNPIYHQIGIGVADFGLNKRKEKIKNKQPMRNLAQHKIKKDDKRRDLLPGQGKKKNKSLNSWGFAFCFLYCFLLLFFFEGREKNGKKKKNCEKKKKKRF